jgi:catechol 2,3-dioxygenase-like lactoylglutathione lyase family enzyme
MKLEVVIIPVSDVDRAKRFYGGFGWRLDADFATGDEWRVVQLTPPGSQCVNGAEWGAEWRSKREPVGWLKWARRSPVLAG